MRIFSVEFVNNKLEAVGMGINVTTIRLPLWIYFEGSTSSMRATVLLQTVCNALVQGQRLFLTMPQICQLEGGFW